MSQNKITLMSEEFENGQSGEKVTGITLIIDGKIKEILDVLIQKTNMSNYTEIMQKVIVEGVNSLIRQYSNKADD